jgi:hypothetical protein
MGKDVSTLTIHQARERLRYENGILHEAEAANHKLYIDKGRNWSGHAQGLELAAITDHVNGVMEEAGELAYNAGKAAGDKFRKRRIAIITARNDARVATRSNLKELTDTITEMFTPTPRRELFTNVIPEEKDGTYNAKALRKWCARTTRVAMLVAEQYVNANLESGGEHIKDFHRVAASTEGMHDTIHKLRMHIQILKNTTPPPVYPPQPPPPGWPYYPPPGYPVYTPHAHHHHQPPQPPAQRHGKRHPARTPARGS